MVVKRYWVKRKEFLENRFFCGWFLFGFIPLYIKEQTIYEIKGVSK